MYQFSKIIWLYPFIMGLMVLGFDYTGEGTDLGGQVYSLSLSCNESPLDILFNLDEMLHGLYYATYAFLYQFVGLSPIHFISLITICNFLLFLLIIKNYLQNAGEITLASQDVNRLIVIALTSFSPILICISRNFFAITLLFLGVSLLQKKRYILTGLCVLGSLSAHEGMKLLYAVFILAFVLKKFLLPFFERRKFRQSFIVITCLSLLVLGPIIFSFAGDFILSNNMVSEKYEDLYLTSLAGDGVYKIVIVLSMLGSLYALVVSSMVNHDNDWVNSTCIAGLFMICLLFNQKIFYVQRIMMLMPLFIALSLLKTYSNKQIHFKGNLLSVTLLSAPVIFLLQLFFWRDIFFSWL